MTARTISACLLLALAARAGDPALESRAYEDYRKVVAKTAAMVQDRVLRRTLSGYGLRILSLTWEDTGRYKDSTVGPNISDMTIQVQQMDPRTERCFLTCMPVIRYPNFSDRTGDVPMDRFFVLVGNEKGRSLRPVNLRTLLGDLRSFLTDPRSWKGRERSLLAPRDTHVLVSAQACFLPVPKGSRAEFNPVLFNYQSYEGNPAVLTLLCTREGTSVTVIDNKRDAFQAGPTWGQRLFFNQHGQRASLTGERLSDFGGAPRLEPSHRGSAVGAAGGLNLVLLVQVPLRYEPRPYRGVPCPPATEGMAKKARSGVEDAVIGHGRIEGPFTEIDGLAVERDPRYPVRVTVQFYLATDDGVARQRDVAAIAARIRKVYREADYVGSLVVSGETGRPTEHDGEEFEPPGWWPDFWARHYANTGQTQAEAFAMLHGLFGPHWPALPPEQILRALRREGFGE